MYDVISLWNINKEEINTFTELVNIYNALDHTIHS